MAETMRRTGRDVHAWAAARPWAVDGALAALVMIVSLPPLWQLEDELLALGYQGPTPVTVGVALAMTAPLAWRRRAPLLMMVVVTAGYLAAALLPVPTLPFGLLIGVYTLTAYGSRRTILWGAATIVVSIVVGLGLTGGMRNLPMNLVVLAATGLFGDWQRLQRARARELMHREELLRRARQELTRLAVEGERQRIAAELRDVLAHAVTAMITQAQAARRLVMSDADRASGPLRAIEETGRTALVELRRLVGLLRDGSADPSSADGDRWRGGLDRIGSATGSLDDAHELPASPGTLTGDQQGAHGARPAWSESQRRRLAVMSPAMRDVLLAGIVVLVELSLQLVYRDVGASGAIAVPGPGSVVVAMVLASALLLRRRLPQSVLAFSLAGAAVLVFLAIPTLFTGVLVAVYTVASRCPRRVRVSWLAATLLVGWWLVWPEGIGYLAGQLLFIGGAWLLGDRQRVSRRYQMELEERARQLELAQQREAALGVAFERTRIARELHDVVGNSLGVMLILARGALRTLPRDAQRADVAIDHVLTCGRESLVRLREVLPPTGDDDGGGLAPQPGLEELPGLVAELGAVGLVVDLHVDGDPAPVPAGVALSAYRIVQEALTNVLKHASTDHAVVRLCHGHSLCLEITDDGHGASGAGPRTLDLEGTGGHGLIGMAERVRLVGGELEVGVRPGGGFRVAARLPVAAPDGPPEAAPALAGR